MFEKISDDEMMLVNGGTNPIEFLAALKTAGDLAYDAGHWLGEKSKEWY